MKFKKERFSLECLNGTASIPCNLRQTFSSSFVTGSTFDLILSPKNFLLELQTMSTENVSGDMKSEVQIEQKFYLQAVHFFCTHSSYFGIKSIVIAPDRIIIHQVV
uniref:Uncharacterized protein n=1 Tax=Cucumis melo TaxID=3656 RepID=A0A9I9EC74_CUCME